MDNSSSSLKVNTPSKPRIKRHLKTLQFLPQLTQLLLQLGDVRVDLLAGCGEQRLGVWERELEERVTDFVPNLISMVIWSVDECREVRLDVSYGTSSSSSANSSSVETSSRSSLSFCERVSICS